MGALKLLGHEVILASSTLSSGTPWDSTSIRGLKESEVKDVLVYETAAEDHEFFEILNQLGALNGMLAHPRATFYLLRQLRKRHFPIGPALRDLRATEPPLDSIRHTPPGMRRWFRGILESLKPDVVMMNYAHWDGLLEHQESQPCLRVIDTLDLVSLNRKMQQAIAKFLPTPLVVDATPDEVLEPDFFQALNLKTDELEFRIFDRYHRTIAITTREAKLIAEHTRKTRVSHIPVTIEPSYLSNSYSHSALFALGPNLFNIQGYLYFAKKVLPKVLQRAPTFSLQLTGMFNRTPPEPVDGIVMSGFVPDLQSVYESARFFVCPILGGTGQQIKIVEAMAGGLAVIASSFAAERSPIIHGVNGLVAGTADEFAEHTVRLWNDPGLCRRLGEAARETVAREFSRDHLAAALSNMLEN